MALTLLAQEYAAANGGSIVTLTVDHGLRPESRAEAEQVAAWMRAHGITHHILTPAHRDVSNNLQEAARIWRYDVLAEFCAQHGILHCLIAHHAGDNRETLLHSQSRGNTQDGSAGMARIRNHRGIRFLRPLLAFERAELAAFLCTKNAEWIDDPSNKNEQFARVRNRKLLQQNAAQNAVLDEALSANAAARAQRDDALAEAAVRCVMLHPLGFAEIALDKLLAFEATLASQLVADTLTTISGATHRPRAHETARLMRALQYPLKKRTLHRCEITAHKNTLLIAREPSRVAQPVTLTGSGRMTWDDRFRISYRIPNSESLTLRALGHDGRKQLNATRIPLATPSLWHLDTCVSVPYISTDCLPSVTIVFAPPKPLAGAPFW